MKIEIDLKDILHDEHGDPTETVGDSIRRQVVEHIAAEAKKAADRQIREEVARVLDECLKAAVTEQMPGIVANLMDHPYTPVDRYGRRSEPTTFRSELLRKIQEEMVYEKPRNGYSNDRNAFTKAVDATVETHLAAFKSEFHKQVDARFVAESVAHVSEQLRKRLGVAA